MSRSTSVAATAPPRFSADIVSDARSRILKRNSNATTIVCNPDITIKAMVKEDVF